MAFDSFMHGGIDLMLSGIDVDFLTTRYISLDFLVNLTKRTVLSTLGVQFEAVHVLTIDASMCIILLMGDRVSPVDVVS